MNPSETGESEKPDESFDDEEAFASKRAAEMARVDKLCTALDNIAGLVEKIKKEMSPKIYTEKAKPPPVKRVTFRDIIQHTRTSDVSTVHYFTSGHKVRPESDKKVAENPFILPSPDGFIDSITFKAKKVQKKRPRHAYVEYCNQNVFDRLDIPIDNSEVPLSKLDYDQEYFTLVRGRPIKEYFDRRKFAANHRKCFFKKLCAGFLEDEIKRQEEHHIRDLYHMYNIREELDKIIQSFEVYLSEDYDESVKIIEEANQIAHMKEEKAVETKRSGGYMNAIKCALYKMGEELNYEKFCKETIYQISPSTWQESYEKKKEDELEAARQLAEEMFDHYQEYLLYNPEHDKFLDRLVASLIHDILNLGPPLIYFENPWEIDLVFKEFEIQNLHAARHLADVEKIHINLKTIFKHLVSYYQKEFECLEEKINDLKEGIQYHKDRSLELEQIAKQVTQTVYKDVVSGDNILETSGLVQDLFDEVIGSYETKLSSVEMMEMVENEIISVTSQVQEISRVKYAEYGQMVDAKMKHDMQLAEAARRREKEIVHTLDRLTKSYQQPEKTFRKKPVERSEPPPIVERPSKKPLTKKEKKRLAKMRKKSMKRKEQMLKRLSNPTRQSRKSKDERKEKRSKLNRIKSFMHGRRRKMVARTLSVEKEMGFLVVPEKLTSSRRSIRMSRRFSRRIRLRTTSIKEKKGKCFAVIHFASQPRLMKKRLKKMPKISVKISRESLLDEVFAKKYESESTESEEPLSFEEHAFNFNRIHSLHRDLLYRLKMYREFGGEYYDHMSITAEEYEGEEYVSPEGQFYDGMESMTDEETTETSDTKEDTSASQ